MVPCRIGLDVLAEGLLFPLRVLPHDTDHRTTICHSVPSRPCLWLLLSLLLGRDQNQMRGSLNGWVEWDHLPGRETPVRLSRAPSPPLTRGCWCHCTHLCPLILISVALESGTHPISYDQTWRDLLSIIREEKIKTEATATLKNTNSPSNMKKITF